MEQARRTVKDKQALKIALNEIELDSIPHHNSLNNTVNLRIDSPMTQDDELERKIQLLDQRVAILEKTTVKMWSSLCPIVNIIAILSLSGMQLGFGLIQITTVYDHLSLYDTYNFKGPKGLALGAMVGFMPLGAIFGSIFGKCIIKCVSLKEGHHLINIVCMISSFAFMQINQAWAILIGRFIYGMCIACYCSWSPLYLHDLIPINLKTVTRSMYSTWVVGSMMLGYLFGLIFYQAVVSDYYRIMFCFPGILALIQLVLMIIFVPRSPGELFFKQNYDDGRKVLQQIYSQEFVDVMVYKYKLEAEVKALRLICSNPDEVKLYPDGKFRARFMGIFLNLFKELTGINTIIIYAGFYLTQQSSSVAPYADFCLTSLAFLATIASHFLIKNCPRRITMVVISGVYIATSAGITVAFLISSSALMFSCMLVAVLFYGITYSTISSIYPSEILKNQQASFTSLTVWPAMFLVTFIPPVVADVAQPTHTPWPMFVFYAVFSLLSALYIGFCAVESRNKAYDDILKQF